MSALRVLYVHSSAGRYGADRQLELLARTLDRDRVQPLALLPFGGPLVDDLRAADTPVIHGPLAVLRRELLTPAGLARLGADVARVRPALRRLVERERVDLIHVNTSVILGLGGLGVPVVQHVREIYPPVPVAGALQRRRILAADRVVCVSHAVRDALTPQGARPPDWYADTRNLRATQGARPPVRDAAHAAQGARPRVRVVVDGLAVAPERAERGAARAALGLPPDAFVVAVLGRISAWKGQEVLARALNGLPGAVGLVAGDVWPGQEHHETALRAADTAGRLRLVGFRDDVDTVYGAADVVVVPSTQPDPLPNSALEAAAAGCCVVAAAHGGLPEIIRDGETGRLVTPGDHDTLRAVLAQLQQDPTQRDRLGAAAAADVRARFAPERLAERMTALYEEIPGLSRS